MIVGGLGVKERGTSMFYILLNFFIERQAYRFNRQARRNIR